MPINCFEGRAASAARYSVVATLFHVLFGLIACAEVPIESPISSDSITTTDAGDASTPARDGSISIPTLGVGTSGTSETLETSDAGALEASDDGGGAIDASDASETSSPCASGAARLASEQVLGHHGGPSRRGAYVQPGLSREAALAMHRDPCFDGSFTGVVHAQPLYVEDGPGGKGAFFVATESNDVIAFDASTGLAIWTTNLGIPADVECPACAAVAFTPIGITGTPVISTDTRTLYVDSVLGDGLAGSRVTKTHLIHALSLDDGTEREGWPVDPKGMTSNGHTFDPTVQNQRGALVIAGGMLYVPYGSLGDCGDYNGWIIAIDLASPGERSAYATPGAHSGIWATGGVAARDDSIFVATGNGLDAEWAGSEAVLRFPAGVPLPSSPADFFAPSNWQALDAWDQDLGGSGVTLLTLPGSTPSALAIAFGKDGFAYLLDQNALGGLGEDASGALGVLAIASHDIVTAPAAYTTSIRHFVALDAQSGGTGIACPAGQSGDLIGLEIVDGSPPTMSVAWCANNLGHGAPIVTTTDGDADPIVWVTSDASQRLHGYDGLSGALLFDGGADAVPGMNRFNTVVAVHDRIVVAANGGLYAFRP